MINWPSSYKLPSTSFNAAQDANSLRTQMDSGTFRQRRRFGAERVTAGVRWELSDIEFGVFVAFHKHKLNLGNDWFVMPLPLGGGTEPHVVRFVEGQFSQVYRDVGYWDVSAQLEVLERYVFSEGILDFYLLVGFSDAEIENLLSSIANFHQCVHVTLPTNLN